MLALDPFALDEAVAALRRFGLVKATEQLLTVHRLVQQVIRDQLDPATRATRAAIAVRLLAAALPFGGYADPGLWPVCARLLPHALAATEHAAHFEVELFTIADLLDSAADYLQGRAQYAEACALRERALAICEATWAPATPSPRKASTTSPPSWPTTATSTPPVLCTSALFPSARPALAPTTLSLPKASPTSPPSYRTRATCLVLVLCTSVPSPSTRPALVPTTPIPNSHDWTWRRSRRRYGSRSACRLTARQPVHPSVGPAVEIRILGR